MKQFLDNQKAYGFIDSVLFAPLFMLLLLVGVDAGSAYLEQAAISDALRDSLNEQGIYTEIDSVFEFTKGDYLLNEKNVENLLESFSQTISSSISKIKNSGFKENKAEFKINLIALELLVNQESGALESIGKKIYYSSKDGNPQLELSPDVTGLEYLSDSDFVLQKLAEDHKRRPSKYAVYLGSSYNQLAAQSQYLPKALVIYLEVSYLSNSLSPKLTKSLLGRFYTGKEQILIPLRTILS